jgi:hypothetical protein
MTWVMRNMCSPVSCQYEYLNMYSKPRSAEAFSAMLGSMDIRNFACVLSNDGCYMELRISEGVVGYQISVIPRYCWEDAATGGKGQGGTRLKLNGSNE